MREMILMLGSVTVLEPYYLLCNHKTNKLFLLFHFQTEALLDCKLAFKIVEGG